jgi:hypothetical protein
VSSSTLTKWCGLAAMLGAVLWALWAVVVQSVGWGEPGSAAISVTSLSTGCCPSHCCPSWWASLGCMLPREGATGG